MDGLDPAAIRASLEQAVDMGLRYVRIRQGTDEFEATLSAREFVDEAVEEDRAESSASDGPAKKVLVSGHVGLLKWVDGIESGVTIHEGDRLGEITALGISNEIVSNINGQIATVFELNGAPVDFGRVLLEVSVE